MKSFLEEYGFAILAAIVVILLIAMSTPVGTTIKTQIMNLINNFGSSAKHKIDKSQQETIVVLTQTPDLLITSESTTDKFDYVIHHKDHGEDKTSLPRPFEDGFTLTEHCDSNSNIFVEVINRGTGEKYISNTIQVPQEGFTQTPSQTVNLSPNDVIELENKKYVILQSKGDDQYLVMCIDSIGSIRFDSDSNVYENSDIDNYLHNDYYTLKFKDAIIEQDIQQNFYSHDSNTQANPNYKWVAKGDTNYNGCNDNVCVKQPDGTWISWKQHTPIKGQSGALKFTNQGSIRKDGLQANVIKRKVFLPSIQEVSQVVNVNDQWEMDKFLRYSPGGRMHMWFRDSRFEDSSYVLFGSYNNRSLYSSPVRSSYFAVRPAFVVDLSKVDFISTNTRFVD